MGTDLKQRELSGHFCECGCGKETYRAIHRNGHHVPGEPLKCLPGHYNRNTGPRWIEEDRGYRTPCHIWQLSTDKKGYGRTWHERDTIGAHRKSYIDNKGEIQDDFEVDHLCGQRSCVNPDHLLAVTKKQNLWRMFMRTAGLDYTQIESLREWMMTTLRPEQIEALWSDDVER
jgi:hypothetical protein